MTSKFMTDPIRVLVKRDEITLEGIKQVRGGGGARRARRPRLEGVGGGAGGSEWQRGWA